MSVHLVETSEEDSYLAVTRHVADLLNEGQVSRRLHSDEVLCFSLNIVAHVAVLVTAITCSE